MDNQQNSEVTDNEHMAKEHRYEALNTDELIDSIRDKIQAKLQNKAKKQSENTAETIAPDLTDDDPGKEDDLFKRV